MKFWQRIFLSTLIIFVIAFDAGALVLTAYSYGFNKQREIDSSVREQSVILSTIEAGIKNAELITENAANNSAYLAITAASLAEYYKNQGVFLAIFLEGKAVYSNTKELDPKLLKLSSSNTKRIADKKIGGSRYLFISSRVVEYPNLIFVYSRDITRLDEYRKNISRVFAVMNIAVCAALGAAVFILLKRMTRPIDKLNSATSEIAGGAYEKRVEFKRRDELGELGRTFNRMADSVEEQMEGLKKSASDKQQFIDNLAHELKTPLTAILGYSEFLQGANCGEAERLTAAEHLHEAALRLQNLSAKLLELTLLRGSGLEKAPVDIAAPFSALNVIMAPVIQERQLTLVTETAAEAVCGDEVLLLSLLTNLVENAARASHPKGKINVTARAGDGVILEVTDEGAGIADCDIEKLTAPFYRADKSRSREFGGVGLGLSICRLIADLHGARLDISSRLGEGTAVAVSFPAFESGS